MSNNKQNHIGDTNKMVSSVELLRCKMIALTLLKLNQTDRDIMEHFFEQAKEMHKEEIENARLSLDRSNMSDFPKALNNATDYYNETFKNNEQQ